MQEREDNSLISMPYAYMKVHTMQNYFVPKTFPEFNQAKVISFPDIKHQNY